MKKYFEGGNRRRENISDMRLDRSVSGEIFRPDRTTQIGLTAALGAEFAVRVMLQIGR